MAKVFLKVKIKSLAVEARIIRHEEAKYPRGKRNTGNFYELNCHRRHDVRSEARAALLAYGYLRGRLYTQVEAKCYEEPSWIRVAELLVKYGGNTVSYSEPRRRDTAFVMIREWAKGAKPSLSPPIASAA